MALRSWLIPAAPAEPAPITDPAERRALKLELVIVFGITLGLSGALSLLSLLDALLAPQRLADQQVALNAPRAAAGLVDLLTQLLLALRLVGWGALGLYLLWRGGTRLAAVGLDRTRPRGDVARGVGLAALIGVPGLAFYLVAYALGLSLQVQPSTLEGSWWRPVVLVLAAFGNAFAEEVLVVGYLLTGLRRLGVGENRALLGSAVLRGSYHLYQGFGGFLGNLVMGLVFGRFWQRINRLWALVLAHTLLDVVAFVGYSLLRGKVSWLPG